MQLEIFKNKTIVSSFDDIFLFFLSKTVVNLYKICSNNVLFTGRKIRFLKEADFLRLKRRIKKSSILYSPKKEKNTSK